MGLFLDFLRQKATIAGMTPQAFITLAIGATGLLLAKEPPRQAYILTGQSNSLGAVKGSPASPELLQQYESTARLWNGNMNRDSGECFEKNQQWATVAPQLPRYNGNLCMGPEYGFAAMMQRLSPSSGTDIIKASLDGGGNHYWQPGGKAYNTLMSVVKRAMKAEKKPAKLTALLYLQGESDEGEEVTQARQRFTELVKNLKKGLKKAGIPTKGFQYSVIGEPANWHGKDKTVQGKTTAEELRQLADSRPDIGWVYTRDLTKITRGDAMGVHYDGKSQISIGARFACALLALQGKIPVGMRGDDATATLGSPSAWWGGKSPDKDAIAIWNVASANATETLDKPLSVRGIRIEDTFPETVAIRGKGKALLKIGKDGIALHGANLKLEQVHLSLAAGARISGTYSASLSGGSLTFQLSDNELEPLGGHSYATQKLSAIQDLANSVTIKLSAPLPPNATGQETDILFRHEDGSPVDFSEATLCPPLRAGEPGHLIIAP